MKFNIQYFRELTSTNTVALEKAKEGAPEGLVIVADYQTEGHGKLGRQWVSPPGKNLLLTLLIRPPLAPHQAPALTQLACRSVARVLLNRCGIASTFKRPNDIMVGGKKICGVLVESLSNSKKVEVAAIGIGLNVNAKERELVPGATSLKELTGEDFSREDLLESILEQLQFDLKEIYARSL
jgi:BirA family biotin operon repressor/biotin-[acetyl-CoA-carboxylase] ligase